MDAINAAFKAATGIDVVMNTVDHGTFQDQITNYLGGTPDTAYTWFSGFRMKFFADQGLNVAIDDVWDTVKGNYTAGFANSVVGNDGKVYGIPVDYYPWAVFYRKSVFADKSYTIPTTWDELKTLAAKMQADGLTPFAFGDKDGWPAMGTFDILNLRQNGYDFHVNLMAGKEKWTDSKVTDVFKKWAEIVPFHAKDYAGLTWQQAADTLVQKKAGMYLLGLFVSAQFAATKDPADIADLDFFPYPTLGTAVRRRERPRRTDRHLADRGQVPEPRHRDRRLQGVPRALGQGRHAAADVPEPAGPDPDGDGHRHQHLQRPPEEGRRGRLEGAEDHPVPRPRHPLGLRRGQRHAGVPADVPLEPDQDLAAYQKTIQDFWDSLPPLS